MTEQDDECVEEALVQRWVINKQGHGAATEYRIHTIINSRSFLFFFFPLVVHGIQCDLFEQGFGK